MAKIRLLQQRRGTHYALTVENATIAAGQIVFVTDQNRLKVGTGDTYNNTSFLSVRLNDIASSGASEGQSPVWNGTGWDTVNLAPASDYVAKAGDTMTGDLVLQEGANLQYGNEKNSSVIFNVTGNFADVANSYGINVKSRVRDGTTAAHYFRTAANSEGGTGVTTIFQYWAGIGGAGVQGPLANNRPFFADQSNTDAADTNYGITLNLNSGTKTNYNIYAGGTAKNYFGGLIEAQAGATVNGDVTISDKIVHSGDTNTAIRFPAADTFTIETSGREVLRIDSVSRVKVLQTATDGSGVGRLQLMNSDATTDAGGFLLYGDSYTSGTAMSLGAGSFHLYADARPLGISTSGEEPIVLGTAGTERLRISGAGSVVVSGNLESTSLTTESLVVQHDTYDPTVGHFVYSGVSGHLATGVIGAYVPGTATVTFRKQLVDGATNTQGVRFDAPVYGNTTGGSPAAITKFGITCYPDNRGDLVDFVHFDAGKYHDSTVFSSDPNTEFVDVICYNAQNVFFNATGDVAGFKSSISTGAANSNTYAFYAAGNAKSQFNGQVLVANGVAGSSYERPSIGGTTSPDAGINIGTDVVSFVTDGEERVRVSSAGTLGINGDPSGAIGVLLQRDFDADFGSPYAGSSQQGFVAETTFGSLATSVQGFRSSPTVTNPSGTTVYNYNVAPAAVANNGTVSTQIGLHVNDLNLGNAQAVRLRVNERNDAADQWNLYIDGTAPNYIGSQIQAGGTTGSAGAYFPSYGFFADTDTGLGRIASNSGSLICGGSEIVRFRNDGGIGVGGAGSVSAGIYVTREETENNCIGVGIRSDVDGTTVTNSYGFLDQAKAKIGTTVDYRASFIANGIDILENAACGLYRGFVMSNPNTSIPAVDGIYLDIDLTANSTRYNIYAVGSAPSYFAGNVGVGIDEPTGKLHVAANTELGIRLGTAGASAVWYDIGRNASTGHLVFKGNQNSFTGYDFRTRTGAGVETTTLRVNKTGRVGINTDEPSETLEVTGNAKINGDLEVTGTFSGAATGAVAAFHSLIAGSHVGPVTLVTSAGTSSVWSWNASTSNVFPLAVGTLLSLSPAAPLVTGTPTHRVDAVSGNVYTLQQIEASNISSGQTLTVKSLPYQQGAIASKNCSFSYISPGVYELTFATPLDQATTAYSANAHFGYWVTYGLNVIPWETDANGDLTKLRITLEQGNDVHRLHFVAYRI